ncbi:MAG: M50 family metallopeptidase [candidate division FCPU426 bacterium]
MTGLLLTIPGVFATAVLLRHLSQFNLVTPVQLAFVTGAGVYLVMHLLLWKPIFIHVMGHELTHAFWAVLLGGKIKSLSVSREGGQVTLSKTNFLIALAPYFFPLYTFMLLPIYFIAAPKFYPLLSFFIGLTLAFHLALTLHSLRDRQSDIRQVGVFFSLAFVYFMNLVMVVMVLSIISPDIITLPVFFLETGRLFAAFVAWMAEWVRTLISA